MMFVTPEMRFSSHANAHNRDGARDGRCDCSAHWHICFVCHARQFCETEPDAYHSEICDDCYAAETISRKERKSNHA